MKRKDIAKWLIDHDLTQKQIADDAGVTASLVCHVVRGTRSGKAVMAALKKRGFVDPGEPEASDREEAAADGTI